MDVKILAGRLKQARLRTGLTQADLAEIAGLSESTVVAAESGKRSVRLENLVEMCRALGTTMEQIVTGGENAGVTVEHEAQFTGNLDTFLQAQRELLLSFWKTTSQRGAGGPIKAPELADKKIRSKARVRHKPKA